MIQCSVCGAKNRDLATVCSACKSFLQARPEALDLFSTMWGLMESPRRAMKRIVLSRRKNYAFFLAGLLGIFIVVTALWLAKLARLFESATSMVLTAVVGGALGGVVLLLLMGLILTLTSLLFGGRPSVRNLFAVLAYSGFPCVFVLFLVFPVQFAVFGQYLFDRNPSPMVLNPVVHIVLLGFYGLACLWWLVMAVIGNAIAGSISTVRSAIAVLVAAGLFTGAVAILLAARPFGP
jgi:hypothetical protein